MSGYGFIPHPQCKVGSGDCFALGQCLRKCNPKELNGLSVEQILTVAASRQRKEAGNSSKLAAKIDQLIRDVRGGLL